MAVPVITSQPQSTSRLAQSSVTFSVSATSDNGVVSYQWRKAGAPISGATSSTYTIPFIVAGDAANYTVTVTNLDGPTLSSVATLTVIPLGASSPAGVGSGLRGIRRKTREYDWDNWWWDTL